MKIPFVHWRRISFGDTDPAGIVYTPRFSDYSMEAIEVWLSDYIGVNWAQINLEEQRGTPVVNMEMTFISPLKANDRCGIYIYVKEIGRTSLTLSLRGFRSVSRNDEEKSVFNARFVFCFTENNVRAIPIPAATRAKLEAYVEKGGIDSS